MRFAALCLCAIFCALPLFADDHHVEIDDDFDYSKIRTFTIRPGRVTMARPEFNNPLVATSVRDAIYAFLSSKGLKETSDRPDAVVEFTVESIDYTLGSFGRAWPITGGRGGRGAANTSEPVAFTEGVLVIDLSASGTLIWRGVYRDNEKNSANFAQKLPADAKKLLAQYPPKKR